ncbi:ester cyclase [Pendulispora albinea]|uniref:Ester cyclase n=1 Tax=Pendulispora albinea TaxID=2741071 RepID=A0ABZ2LVV8_9BACT
MFEKLLDRLPYGTAAIAICVVHLGSSACRPAPAAPASSARDPMMGTAESKGRIMNLEENKALVVRVIGDVFNGRKYELADSLVRVDFHSHNPQLGVGPEGLRSFAQRFAGGFPDFVGDIRETMAEGDRVMVRTHWRGTHTGTFAGVRATGNRIEFETVDFFRIVDGKLAEHWDVADRLALQRGLGLIQPVTK